MKKIANHILLAAVLSFGAAQSASADDQQLRERLSLQHRQEQTANPRTTTVAVYTGNTHVARASHDEAETAVQLVPDGHGRTTPLYRDRE